MFLTKSTGTFTNNVWAHDDSSGKFFSKSKTKNFDNKIKIFSQGKWVYRNKNETINNLVDE